MTGICHFFLTTVLSEAKQFLLTIVLEGRFNIKCRTQYYPPDVLQLTAPSLKQKCGSDAFFVETEAQKEALLPPINEERGLPDNFLRDSLKYKMCQAARWEEGSFLQYVGL